jgi:glycosyltransferase involved in cell wall biosynthesis
MIHTEDPLLVAGIDHGVPRELAVGRGQVVFVGGWAFHKRLRISSLELRVAGQSVERLVHSMPRSDVFRERGNEPPRRAYAYRSGFWGFVPLQAVDGAEEVAVDLVATLSNGDLSTRNIGIVQLRQGANGRTPVEDVGSAETDEPLIAICMTTFNPRPELFHRQVASLREQTHRHWMCIVSDDHSTPAALRSIEEELAGDPRFHLSQPDERLGFYRNFERTLGLVPEAAPLVALSDHDDHWDPEKLEVLRERLDPGVNLVYSDMRVVGPGGEQISPTLFRKRRNNYKDLASLMAGNTVTGAASLFRRDLLELALPFPQALAHDFHDQWLASAALYTGRIAYVDRPLQDYVQHDANVFGAEAANRRRGRGRLLIPTRTRISEMLLRWRQEYFTYTRPVELRARLLQLRAGDQARHQPRRVVRRLAALDRGARALPVVVWLYVRSFAAGLRRAPSMGNERLLVRGVAWRHLVRAQSLLRRRRREIHNQALPPPPAPGVVREERPVVVRQLDQKIAPIPLAVTDLAPPRVNMLIPTVDLDHFFGAYIGKFNLARRLAETGLRVRLVAIEPTVIPADWRKRVQSYKGLESLPDSIELSSAATREELRLEVSPQDRFIATTSWTAHVAHHAVQALGRERFLFVIQEYDALTYPVGTLGATTREAYLHPHLAVFSTELLRDFFRQRRLGVYAAGAAVGDQHSTSFRNAITPVEPPLVRELRGQPDSLLFYARPEAHAERNLFELGLMALGAAIRRGSIPRAWRFVGIGAQAAHAYALEGGAELVIQERTGQERYAELLSQHSVGLALMDTPHPSLVPLEMASAGMLVVTSTFETKTPEGIRGISENLIPVEPTLDAVVAGLAAAVQRIDSYEARARGARFDWPRSWDEAFDDATVTQIRALLEGT